MPNRKKLNRMYALALCDLEIAQATTVVYYPEDPEEKKLVDYCMSTTNRRVFSILCIKAALENEGLLPRDAVQKLGTTRATVDTMIKEMEDAGWIEVKRDDNCYRTLFAQEILLKSYIDYSIALADYSLKLDFGGINSARRYAE